MSESNEVFNRKKIMIVDDEDQVREIIRLELEVLDVDFLEASNGKLALDAIAKEKPDVVISDISMPVMTGLEMLEQLKKNSIKVPVVIITGFGDKEKMRKAWMLGAFDFIDKPFQAEQLINTVQIALKNGSHFISQKEAQLTMPSSMIEVSCTVDRQAYEEAKVYCQKKGLNFGEMINQYIKNMVKS